MVDNIIWNWAREAVVREEALGVSEMVTVVNLDKFTGKNKEQILCLSQARGVKRTPSNTD